MVDLNRWENLLNSTGCKKSADLQYRRIIRAYSEKHRTYHNLNHIEQCLNEFDQINHELESPYPVELAIWYHDVVYSTRSDRNEEESAAWAKTDLNDLGIPGATITDVHELIISTKHIDEPANQDSKYLIDIDLSILGAASKQFQEFEKNIRKEYKWVPSFIFRKKRSGLLKAFLERRHIYYTELFRDKYEQQARNNLTWVLSN